MACCLAALCGFAPGVQAQDSQGAVTVVEGQRFAGRVKVADTELRLNGTGVRAVGWFKAYAAALYLREAATSAGQVQTQTSPKRLQLRMLRDLPASELAKAVRKGVLRNSSEQEAQRLASVLAAFEAQIIAVPSVRKGDVVDLDLDTAGALRFSMNGTLRAEWPGAGPLYAAVLRAFVGDKPYDEQLKAGLLGQSRAPPPAR